MPVNYVIRFQKRQHNKESRQDVEGTTTMECQALVSTVVCVSLVFLHLRPKYSPTEDPTPACCEPVAASICYGIFPQLWMMEESCYSGLSLFPFLQCRALSPFPS